MATNKKHVYPEIRLGHRVHTDVPAESLTGAAREPRFRTGEAAPEVDPATWRRVRLRAEPRCPDGGSRKQVHLVARI